MRELWCRKCLAMKMGCSARSPSACLVSPLPKAAICRVGRCAALKKGMWIFQPMRCTAGREVRSPLLIIDCARVRGSTGAARHAGVDGNA